MIPPVPTTPTDGLGVDLACRHCSAPVELPRKRGRPAKFCSSSECQRVRRNVRSRDYRETEALTPGIWCWKCREPLAVPHRRGCDLT